jgi:hypothetical protein
MSDFLTSLAARSLGAAPTLAPRRASRFEGSAPAAAEAGTAWGEAPAAEIASPRAAASPAAPASPSAGRLPSPSSAGEMAIASASPSPVHSAEPVRGEMAGPREETTSVHAIPSPKPAPVLVPQPPHRREKVGAAPVMGIAPVGEDAPRFASPSPEVRSGEVAPASVIRVETPIVEPVRETRIVERERETVREVAEVRAADESPRSMPVIVPRIERVIASPAASPPPRQPSMAAADSEVEAAPVIHVSIGRIEVRAAQPAPQPRTAPAPAGPPRTSLGDYLRNSSRRRP